MAGPAKTAKDTLNEILRFAQNDNRSLCHPERSEGSGFLPP